MLILVNSKKPKVNQSVPLDVKPVAAFHLHLTEQSLSDGIINISANQQMAYSQFA
jgi:hypothetical protein